MYKLQYGLSTDNHRANPNVMYSVYCDVRSKDGVSHMNARAILSYGRTVKENCGETVCIHFFGP
jgi:hypothetical protein